VGCAIVAHALHGELILACVNMAGMRNCYTIFYNGIERPLTERKRMTDQDRKAILKASKKGEPVARVLTRAAFQKRSFLGQAENPKADARCGVHG
jgi:hypothetical protein